MNTPNIRNVLVAAAISLGISVDAAPAKNIAVQRQEMTTKLQACLEAGFTDWEITGRYEDEKGNTAVLRSKGSLLDEKRNCELGMTQQPKEGCPKVPTYAGGFRNQYDAKTRQRDIEQFTDTNRPGIGAIKIFQDQIWTNDGKDPRDEIKHVVCYGREAIPAKDQKVINKMGIPDCTDATSQTEAQKEYDDFMLEAASQCDYKAEIDVDFGKRLKKILGIKK